MNILIVHNALTTFVRIDRDLLQENYAVEELYLKRKVNLNPIQIWKSVKRNDLVFGWFASWHTFLPILFAWLQGKPSILVAGGYDTANVPEAGYGNQQKWLPRLVTNTTIRLAKRVICNSKFTKLETMAVSGIPENRITVVYHGLPAPQPILPTPEKENIVLNVGNLSKENLLRKGILPFLQTAALMPDYRFIHVGKWKDKAVEQLLPQLASNAELKGFVSEEELMMLYAKSKFYVQPSLHEGFGMSVVEAMQYGGIPLISPFGALPEVTGDCSVIYNPIGPDQIAHSIRQINKQKRIQKSSLARKIALTKYSLGNRKEGLMNAVETALL
ncbi:glycosyltransferase [Phaeodactylibacter xiamenensis]|uniref:glycosyltransferase n=1 Tax=Phaeodactylibacter xiamenensis TaxID=1524460 RepID=UPI003CCC42AB